MIGGSHIDGNRRVQTQGFVDGVLEVRHVFQIVVNRTSVRPDAREDLVSQFCDDFWVPRQFLEGEGEGSCRCVSAG